MAILISALALGSSVADIDELDGRAPDFGLILGFSSAFMVAWVVIAVTCGLV